MYEKQRENDFFNFLKEVKKLNSEDENMKKVNLQQFFYPIRYFFTLILNICNTKHTPNYMNSNSMDEYLIYY